MARKTRRLTDDLNLAASRASAALTVLANAEEEAVKPQLIKEAREAIDEIFDLMGRIRAASELI